jgi:ribosome hibernation promoting factor
MKTEIIGRNVQVDDRLRQYAEQKLHKLEKFLEEPAEARVTLVSEKHTHVAELHVSHRLGVLQATEQTDGSFNDAVHRAIDRVEEQARRAHQKAVDKRRRAGHDGDRGYHRWPVEILEQGSVGAGFSPRVIETTHLAIKPMTIEEAAIELDTSEDGFVVFRDSASDRLSVLYKRKDQHYGLIAPEL